MFCWKTFFFLLSRTRGPDTIHDFFGYLRSEISERVLGIPERDTRSRNEIRDSQKILENIRKYYKILYVYMYFSREIHIYVCRVLKSFDIFWPFWKVLTFYLERARLSRSETTSKVRIRVENILRITERILRSKNAFWDPRMSFWDLGIKVPEKVVNCDEWTYRESKQNKVFQKNN